MIKAPMDKNDLVPDQNALLMLILLPTCLVCVAAWVATIPLYFLVPSYATIAGWVALICAIIITQLPKIFLHGQYKAQIVAYLGSKQEPFYLTDPNEKYHWKYAVFGTAGWVWVLWLIV